MAKDVITRFKLETTQYDSALRTAAKGLSDYAKTASNAGKDFDKFTKDNIEAAKALGTMSVGATNAKDKVKELVGAYNEAAKAYESLSAEQKQADWAKAFAGSLTTLQQRIKDAKEDLYGLGDAISKTGSNGGGLFGGGKLDGMLQVFGGNLMTKGASMLAGFASEIGDAVKQGVELAKAGEGIRIAFERLGRGDILQGLREATHGTVTDLELMKAAVKFNDFKLPIEELGTMLAFAQQKAKDTGQSVDYMVDSIVTGLGRKSLMILDNLGLSAAEIKEKMKQTGDMTKAVGEIIREQMANAGDYVETAADRAAQANVSLQNKIEELGRKFAPVEEASNQLWTSMKIGILDVVGGPLARLLNGLTEAGRLKNMLNNLNGGGNGNETRTEQALRLLREYSGGGKGIEGKRDLYNRQIAKWNQQEEAAWRSYNKNSSALDAYRSNMFKRGQNAGDQAVIDQLQKKMENDRNRALAIQQIRSEYQAGAKNILNPEKNNPSPTTPTSPTGKTTPKLTDAQQAAEDVKKAMKDYADAISNAQEKVMANMITSDDYDKQVQQGQQRLADAYLKAYNVTGDEKYLEGFRTAAGRYNEMSEVIKGNIDAQKEEQAAARQLAQTQKKVADAMAEAQTAYQNNDLKGYLTAMKKAGADPNQGIAAGGFSYTSGNLDSFIGNLKEQISQADLGSELYNNLTKQLADANALGNLMQEAVKNGIDIAQFDPQSLWQKIFSKNPDDYIDKDTLQNILNSISKQSGKKLQLNKNTGEVREGKNNDGLEKFSNDFSAITGSVNGILSGVQNLGIEIPEGLKETIGVIQTISGILTAILAITTTIQAIASADATASWVDAIIPFANGGIVPHAANGYFVGGNNYSGDTTPILANAGELVLSRSQQGVLASALEGTGMQNMKLEAFVTGEQIRFALNNNGRRTGRGEYVQTNRR